MFPEGGHHHGFKIGTIGGTPIWVRPSFLILVALFVFLDLDRQVSLAHALFWVPVLLISVLVHELAHAAAIAAFGYGSSTIELGGWGGQTSNARRSRPWHEIVISVAGPVSSLVLGGLFLLAFVLFHDRMATDVFVFVRLMLWANIAWGIFNLFPIYPLDGGQVLFNALCQSFFMGLLFFLAGYFTPGAYDRKGPAGFLRDRLLRLGIPLLAFDFLLEPLTLYIRQDPEIAGRPIPELYLDYLRHKEGIGAGPLWFAARAALVRLLPTLRTV